METSIVKYSNNILRMIRMDAEHAKVFPELLNLSVYELIMKLDLDDSEDYHRGMAASRLIYTFLRSEYDHRHAQSIIEKYPNSTILEAISLIEIDYSINEIVVTILDALPHSKFTVDDVANKIMGKSIDPNKKINVLKLLFIVDYERRRAARIGVKNM